MVPTISLGIYPPRNGQIPPDEQLISGVVRLANYLVQFYGDAREKQTQSGTMLRLTSNLLKFGLDGRIDVQGIFSSIRDGALKILELFAQSKRGLVSSDIARKLGLPKSSVHLLVKTLVSAGVSKTKPVEFEIPFRYEASEPEPHRS